MQLKISGESDITSTTSILLFSTFLRKQNPRKENDLNNG